MTTRTATKPRPDDSPFDFNLDAVKAEVDLSPFVVHWAGKRWEFAHMQSLDVWPLMAAADGGDVSAMTGIFRTAMGDASWGEFQKIPLPQYKLRALFNAYQTHSGLREGESQASSDS